jgi:hypothetical protein
MTQAVALAQQASTGVSPGFRNRIINGAMVIDQRNAGASGTGNSNYTVDRWQYYGSQASKVTWQQNAGSVTPPAGFTNYLGVTSSSAYSILTGDYFGIQQGIEGYNVADLNWGTANAKTITLSFWVRSSLTGTFGGALNNSGSSRSYPFTYTISAANTWEQKSVTIAGDTSGTWLTTNGAGLTVNFGLGMGTTFSGTAGVWASANYVSATGATSVVGTNGATFYITGVQLEVGSTATSFDYRPYTTELQLCQRYYAKLGGTNTDANAGIGTGLFNSAGTVARCYFSYPVPMRTKPTVSQSNAGLNDINSGYNVTSINTTWVTTTSMMLDLGSSPSGTGFRPCLFTLSTSNGYVDVTAEL